MIYALPRRMIPGLPYAPGQSGVTEGQGSENRLDECLRRVLVADWMVTNSWLLQVREEAFWAQHAATGGVGSGGGGGSTWLAYRVG
jgi:hypothetical protein